MDVFAFAERLMAMDNRAWARHANPLSGWSRIASAPIIFLAAWSPFWLGWWSAVPITLAVAWAYFNPRLFPPPKTTEAWATRGVLGERVFLARNTTPIPAAFVRINWITTGLALVFLIPTIWGFVSRDLVLAITAWHAVILSKLWFLDRCVWLWDEMKDATPQYRAWARADWAPMAEADKSA